MANTTSRWNAAGSGGIEHRAVRVQFGNLHAALRQGAGLVHRKRGRGAQHLDSRNQASQHPVLRET
ncbi:MAG: hypothetical protein ACYC3R_00715 [Thiomonas delicata]